jgi:putative ABC transport system permease protein
MPLTIVRRLRSLITRFVGVFRQRALEEDVEAEIQSHLDMRTDLLIAQGASPDDARIEARRRFGNRALIKENARGEELLPRLESLTQDVRYGLRLLRRNPGFTAVAVLVLGLGIGLNAAMFSVFDHVLLSPLPFPHAEQLYVVSSHALSLGDARRASSGPDFRDYRDQSTTLAGVVAVIPRFAEVWTGDGQPRVVTAASPTMQFFAVMGINPVLGRVFVPDEFDNLQNGTLLISWNFWKNQLDGDPHVIGRKLRLENVSSTIIGVLPPMPDLYSDVDVWLKLATEPSWEYMNWRPNKFLDVIARLAPGENPRVAEQELTTILRRGVGEPADVRVQLTPLKSFIIGPVTRQLGTIMAAVALVLLVTVLNTAAILLARSITREPELAMRLGLGASKSRIRRQLLVEGALLSAVGGALGVALAFVAVGLVRRVPGIALPRIDGLHLQATAILVSAGIVMVSTIVFTALPSSVLQLDLASAFRGGRTETGRAQRPFAAVVIAEVACAVVLTICAGLLVRSFVRIHDVNVGYQPDRVVSAYLRTNYDSPEGFPFWRNILGVTSTLPGAASSAISDCTPGTGANAATIVFDDRPRVRGSEPSTAACWISADYFRTLTVPLIRGRSFTSHDDANVPPVVIINAEAARRLFPDRDPIGRRIAVNYLSLGSRVRDSVPRLREIVGVVGDMRQRAVDLPPGPAIYLPYEQDETHHVLNSMHLYVRSAGTDPLALGRGIRTQIQSMYPDQPVEAIQVVRQVIDASLSRRTYAVMLMSAFALIALLLCGLGIYGVVSYVMQQRTREFGIRMALGAQRGDVLRNVLRRGGALVAAGVVAGSAMSLLVTRLLAQQLFETPPSDPMVYLVAVSVLGVVGILACVIPAIRASRLDPKIALTG